MKKLLIVDDEERILNLISKYAEFEGFSCECALNGEEALKKFREGGFDLVIMDIMMPGIDGFEVSKEIRKQSDVPIILLSARGEEYDRINGFKTGVDDYVVKPFSPKELMLRVKAILKRAGGSDAREGEAKNDGRDVLVYKSLEIDFTSRIVRLNGQPIDFSPTEYTILLYLAKRKNVALSKDQIIANVWTDSYGDERALIVHINSIRQKLGEYAGIIATVRGVGYRFEI